MICHQGSAGCHCDYSSTLTAAKGLCHQQSERAWPVIPAPCLHRAAQQHIPETVGMWIKEQDRCWHRGGDWHSPASMEQLCHHPAAQAASGCQGFMLLLEELSSIPALPPADPCPRHRNDATRLIPVPAAVLHDPSCASPQHWGNGSGQQLWDIQRALSIPQQPPAQLSTPSQQELCSSTRRLPFA